MKKILMFFVLLSMIAMAQNTDNVTTRSNYDIEDYMYYVMQYSTGTLRTSQTVYLQSASAVVDSSDSIFVVSLSDSVQKLGSLVAGIIFPSLETGTTTLTFEVSADSSTWQPLYVDGSALSYTIIATGCAIPVEPSYFYPWKYVRGILNTAQATSDRTITIMYRGY